MPFAPQIQSGHYLSLAADMQSRVPMMTYMPDLSTSRVRVAVVVAMVCIRRPRHRDTPSSSRVMLSRRCVPNKDEFENVKLYWREYFPYDLVVGLLTRNGDPIEHTEFAFECIDPSGRTFMQRYLSFADAATMKKAVMCRLRTSFLQTIHVGACWSGKPEPRADECDRASHDLDRARPARAPIRIDVDFTDYPFGVDKHDIRRNDAHWPIMNLSIVITSHILKECFGLTDIVSFYSGARGVHIWALDERAWQMCDDERASVVGFMTFPADASGRAKEAFLRRTPLYDEMCDAILLPAFLEMLDDAGMDLFTSVSSILRFEDIMSVTHRNVEMSFRTLKTSAPHADARRAFASLMETIANIEKHLPASPARRHCKRRVHIALVTLLWPRFDKGASTKTNHLMKCPFSPHARTKRVEVVLPTDASGFRPDAVCALNEHISPLYMYDVECEMRAQLDRLGSPKPYRDAVEEWYAHWRPEGENAVMRYVKDYEEEARRFENRVNGRDDQISACNYTVTSKMWAVRLVRHFEVCISDRCLLMRTRLDDRRGVLPDVIRVRKGKTFHWKSVAVADVWNVIDRALTRWRADGIDHTSWNTAATDSLLLLFSAGEHFDVSCVPVIRQRVDAIVRLSNDTDRVHDATCTPLPSEGYLVWSFVYPKIVQSWPVPGVIVAS